MCFRPLSHLTKTFRAARQDGGMYGDMGAGVNAKDAEEEKVPVQRRGALSDDEQVLLLGKVPGGLEHGVCCGEDFVAGVQA